MENLCENTFDISQNSENIENQNEEISSQNKSVNKGGRPRSDIWNEFNYGESDGKGHYGAQYRYCIKGRWKRSKPSVMESHLALYCKGNIPDKIRQHWLVQVAKRNDKDTDHSDNKTKIHSYYISNLQTELKFYRKELSESELHESALNQTTYAEIENTNIMLEQNEDILTSFHFLNHEKLEIDLIVNLSNTNFGGQGDNEEVSCTTTAIQGSENMEFEPATIVE
ncbi:6498_t:CDS:2, partial [Racocetra fulgida]